MSVPQHADRTPDKRPGTRRKRDDFLGVLGAQRDVMQAAAKARLTPRQSRVLFAVLALTTTWSRLQDDVYSHQVVDAVGLDPNVESALRDVRKDLKVLAGLGLIEYAPAVGQGNRSLIGIPPAGSLPLRVQTSRKGGQATPLSRAPAGAERGVASPSKSRRKGGQGAPPTERDFPRENTIAREDGIQSPLVGSVPTGDDVDVEDVTPGLVPDEWARTFWDALPSSLGLNNTRKVRDALAIAHGGGWYGVELASAVGRSEAGRADNPAALVAGAILPTLAKQQPPHLRSLAARLRPAILRDLDEVPVSTDPVGHVAKVREEFQRARSQTA